MGTAVTRDRKVKSVTFRISLTGLSALLHKVVVNSQRCSSVTRHQED